MIIFSVLVCFVFLLKKITALQIKPLFVKKNNDKKVFIVKEIINLKKNSQGDFL